MTSIQVSVPGSWSLRLHEHIYRGRFCRIPCFKYAASLESYSKESTSFIVWNCKRSTRRKPPVFASKVNDGTGPDDSADENDNDKSSEDETKDANNKNVRDNLERMVGRDDSGFSGIDLATLIRNKYGRSYDVQLIKKEFMGKNLLAMNVMWKYREQKSFPLTEEEYLLRLDDVANTLKCWGAVSHIRDSLTKSKERPRIGKAVCIFIDMDESGGRANEWMYK